jgi:hypothetical protein
MIKLLSWLIRPLEKNKEALNQIKKHRQLLHETNDAVDQMIAALDGETGWFECGCREKIKKECTNGTIQNTTLDHSHP